VTVLHYRSDGCDQIVRWIPAKQKGDGLWIFGPGLTPDMQTTGRPSALSGDRARTMAIAPDPSILNLVNRASITFDAPRDARSASAAGAGRCLDSHPGRFKEQGEAVGQCATKVWRYFEDGCYHYQLYNPCSGTWDVLPNGAPYVHWQRCVH
jgi:hypothetical protein